MDISRLLGQRGLLGPDAPVRHAAKRRRIKTVMLELIYRARRPIEHGRQTFNSCAQPNSDTPYLRESVARKVRVYTRCVTECVITDYTLTASQRASVW